MSVTKLLKIYRWQGTYVDYQDGLELSIKYKLDLLTEGLKREKEASWQDWLGPDSNVITSLDLLPEIPECYSS